MKQISRTLIAVGVLVCSPVIGATQQSRSPRLTYSADNGWRFLVGDPADAEKQAFDDHAWRTVDAPHDWSVESAPAEGNATGASGGYAPAGVGWYRRQFTAPNTWKGKRVLLEFDGVAANATVFLNGQKLGEHPYAYTSFHLDVTDALQLSELNEIAVRVDNSKQLASRWYLGSGLYRHVRVVVTDPVHVAPWGVVVRTADTDSKRATLHVESTIRNDGSQPVPITLRTTIEYKGGVVAQKTTDMVVPPSNTTAIPQEIAVSTPQLWEPQRPALYTLRTEVVEGRRAVDAVTTPFGIRTIAWSPQGLLLNGKNLKLVGGSVHHDNGLLGAAAFDRAEERKVELLKAAGFNAVRTAHNPPSPAFLDACDRLGLLVVEDSFDVWTEPKRTYDYATYFKTWWERDVDSMVLRDRNHPSVIFWTIGNEIPDAWTPGGAETARLLVERFRALDPTRPLTQAFPGTTSSKNVDAVMAQVDVSGYNYNLAQNQAADHERVPNRIMMTTESFPADAFEQWSLAQEHPYILGDFVWTAMDYLGESGIGAWSYGSPEQAKQVSQMGAYMRSYMASFGADGKNVTAAYLNGQPPNPISPAWPWHGSDCGDIDVTGFRKPISYYRDVLWNGGNRIHLTVELPQTDNQRLITVGWAVKPTLDSWTWPEEVGKTLPVEVYAKADRVELLLNGHMLGEKPSGAAEEFRARFEVPYQPGKLTARAFVQGKLIAETSLETVGAPVALRLSADRSKLFVGQKDLAFIAIEAVDEHGKLEPNVSTVVRVNVTGSGSLIGIGNGSTENDTSYAGQSFALFHGRALAVIKTTEQPGAVEITASGDGLTADHLALQSIRGEEDIQLPN